MQITCAAAFNPKAWTCASAPRKLSFPSLLDLRDYQSRRCPVRSARLNYAAFAQQASVRVAAIISNAPPSIGAARGCPLLSNLRGTEDPTVDVQDHISVH